MENNKNVIRLTEEDLNNIIKESVQQILKHKENMMIFKD